MSGLVKNLVFAHAVLVLGLFFFNSCNTHATAERRLTPPRSISELRLDDIARYTREDPARAVHLIEVYRVIYGTDSASFDADDPNIRESLDRFWEEAIENMKTAQLKAIDEKNWPEAVSLARSLSVLGIPVESTGAEPELVLQFAREQVENGVNLAAFLAAVEAHQLKPLDSDDAFFFLEKAVTAKQRRTAAFFLNILDSRAEGHVVPQELR